MATRDLAERLRTNPVSVEGTLASIVELAARVSGIAADVTAGTEHLPSLAAFARVYTLFMTPEIVQQWQQDRVFGSQRLGGLNPMIIRRVTADGTVGAAWPALRAKLSAKISDTAVQPFLGPQATLQAAVNQGRLFVADYQALGEITGDQDAPGWQRGRRIMAPIALYVRSDEFVDWARCAARSRS